MNKYSQGWKKRKQKLSTKYHGVKVPLNIDSILEREAEHTRGGISGVIIKALKTLFGVK